MSTSRRDFFKVAGVGGVAATVFGFDLKPAYAQLKELKIARAAETRSTCPYCAVVAASSSIRLAIAQRTSRRK